MWLSSLLIVSQAEVKALLDWVLIWRLWGKFSFQWKFSVHSCWQNSLLCSYRMETPVSLLAISQRLFSAPRGHLHSLWCGSLHLQVNKHVLHSSHALSLWLTSSLVTSGRKPSYLFIFLAALRSMGDLSFLTRIEPVPPAMEARSLNHWTDREVPKILCFKGLL